MSGVVEREVREEFVSTPVPTPVPTPAPSTTRSLALATVRDASAGAGDPVIPWHVVQLAALSR